MPSSITWTTDFGITLSMGFDAVLAETHELEGEATMHSVEKGSDITDHVHINPEVISQDVLITNQPLTDTNLFGLPVGKFGVSVPLNVPENDQPFVPTPGAVFNAVGSAIKSLFTSKANYTAQVLKFFNTQNYCSVAQDTLWQLLHDRQLITVNTNTRSFDNMVLVRAPMTRRPDLGDAVQFALEFHNVRLVETAMAVIPKETKPSKRVDKGKKSPKEVEKTSVALDLAGGASAVVNFLKSHL